MGCNIDSVNVSYTLWSIVGEPGVTSNIEWTGTPANCLPGKSFHVSAKLEGGGTYAYVDLEVGVVKNSGEGWGFNVAGSPNWDKLYCGYGTYSSTCWDATTAKAFYKSTYTVTDFVLW